MAAEDYLPHLWGPEEEDDDGGGWSGRPPQINPATRSLVTCKRCGERDLVWAEVAQGWRLHTEWPFEPHQCSIEEDEMFDPLEPLGVEDLC